MNGVDVEDRWLCYFVGTWVVYTTLLLLAGEFGIPFLDYLITVVVWTVVVGLVFETTRVVWKP